jgi:hypothetical protein
VTKSACAKQILTTVARHAYRRPVTGGEVDDLMRFYSSGRAPFDKLGGRRLTVASKSRSPSCSRARSSSSRGADLATVAAGATFEPDFELASRLSFFLWSTVPTTS